MEWEKEKALILKSQNDSRFVEALLRHHQGIIDSCAHKMFNHFCGMAFGVENMAELDDVKQMARINWYKLLPKFQLNFGQAGLHSFIYGAISKNLKRDLSRMVSKRVSIDKAKDCLQILDTSFVKEGVSVEPGYDEVVTERILQKLDDSLSSRHRESLRGFSGMEDSNAPEDRKVRWAHKKNITDAVYKASGGN